ncbi:MAG: sulfatase-like hydrolase/transferase [Chloroflexi bacterium]|nr:sulfatase-like hydrolase/transferase [Chloroflexota bacterium]MBU1750119.1 sulfatase-like hydrolase/transferase [Chloroflexota bacterium]
MSKWLGLGALALGLALLMAGAAACTEGIGGLVNKQPPNVIVILADALRADRLSCYGYTGHQTPNIDALAQDAVRYRLSTGPAAWTKPACATLITSLYPSSHRAQRVEDSLPDAVTTLAEVLSGNGYHTAAFFTNHNLREEFNFQQGYQEYHWLAPEASSHTLDGQTYYQEAEMVNQQVMPWLAANQKQPFFLYVHYMDPHRPYFEHPYNGRGEDPRANEPADAPRLSALYDGEVRYLDEQIGVLLAEIKRLGLYDNSLIVFVADHGEEFQEHDGWAHCQTLYQEIVGVPIIIRYPGGDRSGTVDEGLARTLDVAPTILDMAGVEAPAAMEGVSLRLPANSPARAQWVFAEEVFRAGMLAIRTPQYKLIRATPGEDRGRGTVQLYDLLADPGETHNLAEERPDLVSKFGQYIDQTMAHALNVAVTGKQVDIDKELEERLRQLGY